jgi:peptidoglycan/xylan/chitin deacetylase (PgdA/CDA1 family)
VSITRGQFLRSLSKSLPGLVASTGVATAAEAIFRRVAQAGPPEPKAPNPPADAPVAFLHQVQTTERAVAFTFDDGPAPGITERILDALRARNARATFFMIGEKVAAAPELARRVLEEGHELGHHTWSHPNLTQLPDARVDDELDRPAAAFQELLGTRAAWFRPPFGALRQDQARRVRARGMRVTMWSVDPQDWRPRPGAEVTQHIAEHVHPGAIILCHEMFPSAESLGATLTQTRAAGYRFVTLSELNRLAAD